MKKNKNSKSKNIKTKIKQDGGNNVVSATVNLIDSMIDLGKSIFVEIKSITNISSDINNAASPSPGTPGQIDGPKTFNQPQLKR